MAAAPALAACDITARAPEDRIAAELRAEVVADELRLVALYESAVAARPDLPLLATILAEHHRHAAALADPGSTSMPMSSSGAAPLGPDVIAELVAAEKQAALHRAGASSRASEARLAGELALIGASEAGHVVALGGTA